MSELFTVKELAAKLKVSTQFIYQLEQKGKLQGIRIGGNLRFSGEAINEMLRKGCK
jgi:excisionase family DNA binding protein